MRYSTLSKNELRIIKAVGSLSAMLQEMNRKRLELRRITKTACFLRLAGISVNSIPEKIIERCINEQEKDGGWVSIVDTMWNVSFLKILNLVKYQDRISCGLKFLEGQTNRNGLWGRSQRDVSRIPVTGMMFYILPELATHDRLYNLENLWESEINSLTYKAAYLLMAFKKCSYKPKRENIIADTLLWLGKNQRDDGSFSPWKEHPVASDIFCTSVSSLGLLQYHEFVPADVFKKALSWIEVTQLPQGIWAYHEIEDGASWGLWAMAELSRYLSK
ncbi:MAG: hypothetical protein BWK80_04750 [Desulfobacteraceae bacterium IS3]|nr:MAG: hypothetical protein BWK80_04750 [Desulfobacteraceae bacterium IS3]